MGSSMSFKRCLTDEEGKEGSPPSPQQAAGDPQATLEEPNQQQEEGSGEQIAEAVVVGDEEEKKEERMETATAAGRYQIEGMESDNPFPKYTANKIRSLNSTVDDPTYVDFRDDEGKWVVARIEKTREDAFLVHMIQKQGNRRPNRGGQREGQKEGRRGHGRQRGRAGENADQDFWIPFEYSHRCADFQTLTQTDEHNANPNPFGVNDIAMVFPPKFPPGLLTKKPKHQMIGKHPEEDKEGTDAVCSPPRSEWIEGRVKKVSGQFIQVDFHKFSFWFHCHDRSEVRSPDE